MGFFGMPFLDPYYHAVLLVQIIVAIYLVIDILFKKNDPQVCLGWLLGTVLFPLITFCLYVAVGINPFFAGVRKRRRAKLAASPTHFGEYTNSPRTSLDLSQKSGFPRTAEWIGRSLGGLEVLSTPVELLRNSGEIVPEVIREISQARNYVVVQFYQIQADKVGFEFLELLAKKAESGLLVHVLFDALGSFSLKPAMLKGFEKRGVKINRFLDIHPLKRRFQINYRNHRKLILIDGEIAFVGGFNIGKMYLQGPNSNRPKWIDISLKFKGPIIKDLGQQFVSDWSEATGERLLHVLPSVNHIHEGKEHAGKGIDSSSFTMTSSIAASIQSGPDDSGYRFYSTLIQVLLEARSKVFVMTPYFVPDKAIIQCLRIAVSRGVAVRIIIPKKSNHELTDLCSASFFSELKGIGVEILRYPYGVCHAKLLVADDELVLSGSSNLDYRSFFLNFETDLFVLDRVLAADSTKFWQEMASMSVPLSDRDISLKPWLRHLSRRVMRLFAPLM
jgi:cardiolipin synthase